MTTSQSPHARIVHQIHALFGEGRFDKCLELATDDIEIQFHAFGTVQRGREEFMQFMTGFKTAFPDMRITHAASYVDGETVVVEGRWTGTHTGPLMTPAGAIPATGKRVGDGRFCEVFRMRDGKVSRISNYQDVASWLRQLGLA